MRGIQGGRVSFGRLVQRFVVYGGRMQRRISTRSDRARSAGGVFRGSRRAWASV